MWRDARAFWLREPGAGRDPAGAAARARAGRCRSSAPCAPASAGAPRRWCSAAACRASQYATMRAPFQDGDFPAPVKYGYLNVGVVEQRPPRAARPHRVLPVPAPDARTSCRPRSVVVVPDGVPPARAVLAGTVETAVNALWDAAPLRRRPGHGRRRRHGRLLRRAPARAVPGRRGSRWSTSTRAGPRSRPRSASSSRCPPTPPAARPGRAHQRHVGRAAAVARPARARRARSST